MATPTAIEQTILVLCDILPTAERPGLYGQRLHQVAHYSLAAISMTIPINNAAMTVPQPVISP